MKAPFRTFTGVNLDLFDIQPGDIYIEDIAHALSNINRFNGHTKFPISVAQHSIHVALLCPTCPLTALLHDASEAYLGDVTKWLKSTPEMALYRELEAHIQHLINAKFGGLEPLPPEVEAADRIMVRLEGYRGFGPDFHIDHPDYPDMTMEEMMTHPRLLPTTASTIKERFLNVFAALNGRDRVV
jgi:hypothetical protein